jgi:hypothetical protein
LKKISIRSELEAIGVPDAAKYFVCQRVGQRFFTTELTASNFRTIKDAATYIRKNFNHFLTPLIVVSTAVFPDPNKLKPCKHVPESDKAMLCFTCTKCGSEVVSYNKDGELNAKWR